MAGGQGRALGSGSIPDAAAFLAPPLTGVCREICSFLLSKFDV